MMERETPLVSIGVPVFNAERWLSRALDSLLAQQHDRLEIIICDNASQDGTAAICREYARRDSRIRFHENATNIGAIANFGRVLSLATGQYFMWAAADDWWAPEFVSRSVAELEAHPDAGVCMTALRRVFEDGTVRDEIRWSGTRDPATLSPLRLAFATANGASYYFYIYGVYRRALLVAAFEQLPPVKGFDHLFVAQAALATRFRYIDEILHVRLAHAVGPEERYADEDLGIVYGDRWGNWKRAAAAGPFLLRSPVIPPHVKSLVPLVLMGFVIWEIRTESRLLVIRVLDAIVGPRRRVAIIRAARRLMRTAREA